MNKPERLCSVDGCGKKYSAKGFCVKHYRDNQPEDKKKRMRQQSKKWREENREYCLAQQNKYYIENRESLLQDKKDYWIENREILLPKGKESYQKNRESRIKDAKIYYQENKDEIRIYKRKYDKEKYRNDIQYNLRRKLRRRLRNTLKGKGRQEKSTVQLLGCSILELKIYFEKLFTEGMSWEKVLSAEIHIDHIRPLNSFDLRNSDELAKACHYTNLQPLWAIDNLKKGHKWNGPGK